MATKAELTTVENKILDVSSPMLVMRDYHKSI